MKGALFLWHTFCAQLFIQLPKGMQIVGIMLIILGGLMMVFAGFNIIATKNMVDASPYAVNKEHKTPVYWSPIAGGVLVIAGILLMTISYPVL